VCVCVCVHACVCVCASTCGDRNGQWGGGGARWTCYLRKILPPVAVCCSVLQHVAVFCSQEEQGDEHVIWGKYFRLLQCVAVCWSVLQCVATRIRPKNMLFKGNTSACCSVLLYVVVYYSVLQWGGGGGRWTCYLKKILPPVPACCSMLQYADVCSNEEEERDEHVI